MSDHHHRRDLILILGRLVEIGGNVGTPAQRGSAVEVLAERFRADYLTGRDRRAVLAAVDAIEGDLERGFDILREALQRPHLGVVQ